MRHHTKDVAQRAMDVAMREAEIEWDKTHIAFEKQVLERYNAFIKEREEDVHIYCNSILHK